MPCVLITGSNRGIGLEFTRQYASMGWLCISTYRKKSNSEKLLRLCEEFSEFILLEQMDILDHKSIDRLAKKYKNQQIDLIINNAGILGPRSSDSSSQSFGSMDYDFWDKVHKTNTIGPFKIVEAFFENLKNSSLKKIVIISSTVGSNIEMNVPIFSYSSTKAASNKIFTLLSSLLKDESYKVLILCPGNVKTEMGGANALISVNDSVKGMIDEIDRLSIDNSGNFLRFNGEKIQF